jgi:hypothetical protein
LVARLRGGRSGLVLGRLPCPGRRGVTRSRRCRGRRSSARIRLPGHRRRARVRRRPPRPATAVVRLTGTVRTLSTVVMPGRGRMWCGGGRPGRVAGRAGTGSRGWARAGPAAARPGWRGRRLGVNGLGCLRRRSRGRPVLVVTVRGRLVGLTGWLGLRVGACPGSPGPGWRGRRPRVNRPGCLRRRSRWRPVLVLAVRRCLVGLTGWRGLRVRAYPGTSGSGGWAARRMACRGMVAWRTGCGRCRARRRRSRRPGPGGLTSRAGLPRPCSRGRLPPRPGTLRRSGRRGSLDSRQSAAVMRAQRAMAGVSTGWAPRPVMRRCRVT